MVMLAYIIILSGFELAFWSGEFPQLLKASAIGAVLAFAGAGEIAGKLVILAWLTFEGAFIVGPVSDFVGRSVMLIMGMRSETLRS